MGRHAGIFTIAASALGASAFLLPPNVAPASNDEAGALTITPGAFNAKQAAISLPCSDCLFKDPSKENVENVEDEEPFFWIQGGSNNIIVNFTISEDGQRLEADGSAIYPLNIGGLNFHQKVVQQVASGVSVKDIEAGEAKSIPLKVTGSGIAASPEEVVSPEGDVLIPIRYTIVGLEMQAVSLDSVLVKLIRAKSGELFIAHVEAVESEARPPLRLDRLLGSSSDEMEDEFLLPLMPHRHHKERPQGETGREKECAMLPAALCKIKIMLEDRLQGIKKGGLRHGWKMSGCHGRKGGRPHGGMMSGHMRPNFFRPGQEDERPHHHGRPHHMRPHGGRHGHHHRHHFGHSFMHGLLAVLVPTMAGVAVGMAVSLVGLCVGRLIGFLWVKFYRGGRRGYQSVQLDDDDVAGQEFEKTIIVVDDTEPLPLYEEAPAYEATEKEAQ